MIRAHRLWEVFLMKKLGFSWFDLHRDAEELEHASSLEVVEKLYDYLGKPVYCHHGNPIPDSNGKMAPLALKKLIDMNVGEIFVIKRVLDQKELLLYLTQLGIGLDTEFEVLEKNDFAQTMSVKLGLKQLSITYPIAQRIFTF